MKLPRMTATKSVMPRLSAQLQSVASQATMSSAINPPTHRHSAVKPHAASLLMVPI
jgi:hypothetical protein